MPVDGTFPTGTAKFEKRSIAAEIPIWDPKICIDCGLCALVCPHAAIRMKVFPRIRLDSSPAEFAHQELERQRAAGHLLTIQVAPDDCTGCGVCVDVCPAKSKEVVRHKAINMEPIAEHLERERANFEFFLDIPQLDRTQGEDRRRERLAASGATVRVLGRMRRLRRNALLEVDEPVVRRPGDHRQRHRVLVDLWRQPADYALDNEQKAAARPGATRCSKITANSASAFGWRIDSQRRICRSIWCSKAW